MVQPADAPASSQQSDGDGISGDLGPKGPQPPPKGYTHLFKYILVGDSDTGKSALLRRYTDDVFTVGHLPTIGVDFAIKGISLPNGDGVKLQIWDTAGQERYRSITTSYYRGAMGIIIAYDVTRRDTADNVKRWVQECDRYANDDVVIAVVGTKSDLKDGAAEYVTSEQIANYEELKDRVEGFFEASAQTGKGVEDAFQCLTCW